MGVWDEVKTLVEQGVQPKIVLTPSHRIIVPKGKPGRPTKDKYKEAYLLTITGTRMRCRNPGCSHILRVWAENPACCAKCEKELREFFELTLKALNGDIKMQEYPMWLRQLKGAGGRNLAPATSGCLKKEKTAQSICSACRGAGCVLLSGV